MIARANEFWGNWIYFRWKRKERDEREGKIKRVSRRSACRISNLCLPLCRNEAKARAALWGKKRANAASAIIHPRISRFREFAPARGIGMQQRIYATARLCFNIQIRCDNPSRRSLLDSAFGGDCLVSDNSHPIPSLSIVLDFILESRRDAGTVPARRSRQSVNWNWRFCIHALLQAHVGSELFTNSRRLTEDAINALLVLPASHLPSIPQITTIKIKYFQPVTCKP